MEEKNMRWKKERTEEQKKNGKSHSCQFLLLFTIAVSAYSLYSMCLRQTITV